MKYGLVDAAEGSVGPGIAGRIGQGPEGYEGHITFYVEVPDVEAALQKAASLGGTRIMGPLFFQSPASAAAAWRSAAMGAACRWRG